MLEPFGRDKGHLDFYVLPSRDAGAIGGSKGAARNESVIKTKGKGNELSV